MQVQARFAVWNGQAGATGGPLNTREGRVITALSNIQILITL
jgi:hypothetical protein